MKKLVLITLILSGMTFGAYAQQYMANGVATTSTLFCEEENPDEINMGTIENGMDPWDEMQNQTGNRSTVRGIEGGGLFGRGASPVGVGSGFKNGSPFLALPGSHGFDDDAEAPIGSGALLLVGFGAAYLMTKKRKEE